MSGRVTLIDCVFPGVLLRGESGNVFFSRDWMRNSFTGVGVKGLSDELIFFVYGNCYWYRWLNCEG